MTKLLLTITAVFSLSLLLPGNSFTAFSQEDFTGGQGYLIADGVPHVAPSVESFITAYCDKGIMASGLQVYDGAIACPREVPLKTQVKIQGKTYTCEDRTHIRFNGRYDIWNESCEWAINWGIKKLSIQIY